MKLVQLNIWGGRIMHRLPEFFNQQHADIVCMQEVHDIPAEPEWLFESLDALRAKTGLTNKFMGAAISWHHMRRGLDYGNAILSRTPIENRDVVFVQGEYEEDYDVSDHDHPRNFQHGTITVNGRTVHIINFHGAFFHGPKTGNDDTVRHVHMLADYASRFADDPIIITGDFNLAPDSESMQVLNQKFRNLPVEYGITSTYSTLFHIYNVVCDYIFVNEHVAVQSFSVHDEPVSDHRALVLEFDV